MFAAGGKHCFHSFEHRGPGLERVLGRLEPLEFDHGFASGFFGSESDFVFVSDKNLAMRLWLSFEKGQPELELVDGG